LWAIDFLFTLAAGGCQGANFHGGGNGKGYTPIGDDRGSVVGPRPLYCGIYLFTLAGQGKLLACRCDAGGLNVTAYAVETDSGRLNAMVVNKEPRGLPVALDLTGWERGGSLRSASVTRMSDASLSATEGTTIGGSAIEADGSIARHEPERIPVGKGRLRLAMPPLSAALVELG